VGLRALSSEVGNAALKQTALSFFAKCNRGATATEKKILSFVVFSHIISSIIVNLNPVSLQQTAHLFPEHVPQKSFGVFLMQNPHQKILNTGGFHLCRVA